MPSRPIILFDVMETLVTEPFYTAFPEFFGLTMEELHEQKHPTTWVDFEEGTISEEQFLATFFTDGRPVDRDAMHRCLKDSYHWLEGMEEVIAELNASSYEIHALSNYSSWYEIIDETLGLSRYLKWTFVSCKTGLRKPDPATYLFAAEQLKVTPADCLFIDDREENVAAARGVGMPSILRKSTEQLRLELAEALQ